MRRTEEEIDQKRIVKDWEWKMGRRGKKIEEEWERNGRERGEERREDWELG